MFLLAIWVLPPLGQQERVALSLLSVLQNEDSSKPFQNVVFSAVKPEMQVQEWKAGFQGVTQGGDCLTMGWEEKENESMLWSGDIFPPEHIGWPGLRPADGWPQSGSLVKSMAFGD